MEAPWTDHEEARFSLLALIYFEENHVSHASVVKERFVSHRRSMGAPGGESFHMGMRLQIIKRRQYVSMILPGRQAINDIFCRLFM